MASKSRPYDSVKRGLDIAASLIAIVVLSPVIVATAIAVRVNLGSPVLFTQPRPGRSGKVFLLYKFRSMRNVDESHGLVTDEQRLTRFGSALRSTSLDELPSLLNVLRGEMSMVGPRPLLVEYLPRYSTEQARRHEVRPGVTGLAQVNGRNALTWDDKFRIDVAYVDNRSLSLDTRIVARTLKAVLVRDGINAAGHVTMNKFGEDHD